MATPVDHLMTDTDAFLRVLVDGAEMAAQGSIVTFGFVRDRPKSGYGYIRMRERLPGAATARTLAGFVEKHICGRCQQSNPSTT
ncbi:MAG: sugar phosphate nucleotidyltransferase [Thermoleophilia bacterium]|nr:sugar phosphate nucleotidyltransferase [Thermoleophilia bacterium]